MGKAPLPHNKGNCYPPYPDHYLIVNNTLSINFLIVELSTTSLEERLPKKALTKIKTKKDLNKKRKNLYHYATAQFTFETKAS